jgi:2,5-diketo-D-gluconate reductase B
VARRHEATPTQVALAWLREKGVAAIPKASSEAHLRENRASRGLSLSATGIERFGTIDSEARVADPGFGPW